MERPDPESLTAPTPDAAYTATHTFQGQPLEPFSIRREITAQACGHRLLSGRAKMEGQTAYDGTYFDVALVLWLCTLGHEQLDAALRDPAAATGHAMDWAEANGLAFGSPIFTEALGIHFAIMAHIFVTRFTVVPDLDPSAPKKKAAPARSPTAASRNT